MPRSNLLEICSLIGDINPDLTVRAVRLFAEVATEEGRPVTSLHEATGFPLSTTSRLLKDLTAEPSRSKHHPTGAGLVEWRFDPANGRQKLYRLSARGRTVLRKIERATQAVCREAS